MSKKAYEILGRLKGLEGVKQRRAAAVLGALIADAASAPLHWIYDRDKLVKLTEEKNCVVFYPESHCPYYTVPTGSNSAYGDQLYFTLKNVLDTKGFDAGSLQDALYKAFGPGTIYEEARKQSDTPKQGPWTNHCLRTLISNREENVSPAEDTNSMDPDGLTKAVVLAGLLGGCGKNYDDMVVQCVETCQLNKVAKDFAVGGIRLLDHVIKTGEHSPEVALVGVNPDVVSVVKKAIGQVTEEHWKVVKEQGLACKFPDSFYGSVHNANQAASYEEAVKAEILASGDNCSRIIFCGAYTAARYGLSSIPEAWLEKYPKAEEVLGYIERLVSM